MEEQSFRSKQSEQVLEKGESFSQLRRSSLPVSHSWMKERSSVYPGCVTNASGLRLACYQVFPGLRKQCPEPDVGMFLTELTTWVRSLPVASSDGQAHLKSRSLIPFSLVI